jgi:sugar/nucleoside kinase (ribokinase family)
MASESNEPRACQLSGSTVFVGSACWDVIVDVATFPAEDCEVRASSLEGSCGGNASNSAAIAAQLVEQAGAARRVRLASVIGDPASDGISGAFLRSMKNAGVDTRGCLLLPAPATLPQSFIVRADATASRTIFHYRAIREFDSAEEILEAAGFTASGAGGSAGPAAAIAPSAVLAPTIAHFEGRALDATHAAMAQLPPLLPLGSIMSVEVEKPRSSVSALTVLDLLPLADIAFVSREFVCATLTGGVVVSEAAPCPPAALATVLKGCCPSRGAVQDGPDTARGGRCRIVVVPWGAGGVNICVSASTCWQRWHIPCRSPESGVVVDTVGAGDVFIAAFLHAAASFVCEGTPTPTLVELLANPTGAHSDAAGCEALRRTALACAAFACSVAGDKCGVRGLQLPAATLTRALDWAATVTPTST